MSRLNRREKGLVLAAVLAAVLYVLGQTVLFPLWDSVTAASDTIEIRSKRIVNYRKVLLGQDSVKAALEVARQKTATAEAGLLDSKTDALANAEIQGMIKQQATSRGLNLHRTDPFPVRSISPEYSKVSTRVEVSGGIDQLVEFLTGFELNSKILFVEEMTITPSSAGNPKNKGVRCQLVISALKRLEGDVQKKASL